MLCLSPCLTLTPEFVREKTGELPGSLLFTSTTSVAVSLLLDGRARSLFTLGPVAEFYAARSDGLSAESFETDATVSMLVSKENAALSDRLSDVIRKLRDGALDIRAGKVPGRPVEVFGNTVLLYDLGFAGILCSMPEKA